VDNQLPGEGCIYSEIKKKWPELIGKLGEAGQSGHVAESNS
jgi:hypothetical protein